MKPSYLMPSDDNHTAKAGCSGLSSLEACGTGSSYEGGVLTLRGVLADKECACMLYKL